MRLSSFLLGAVTASTVAAQLQYEGYAFAYFTGNSIEGENIYFAASNGNNALDWKELNNGQPALRSSQGTKGLRDPFLLRSQDGSKFWLIATDLSIGSGTSWSDSVKFGSRYLEIWESNDLVNWGTQRHVLVSPPEAGNTWAPEAHWDADLGEYVIYWASSLYDPSDTDRTGPTYHEMLYATTSDFVTFSEAKIWQDGLGKSRIDSTVLEENGQYYRFTKDEGGTTSGCTDIIEEKSANLTATLDGWQLITSCIGQKAGTQAVEGPTSFKSNPGDANGDKYYLFVDEYGARGYIPLETTNIDAPEWKVSAQYSLPKSPRHGTVLPVTAEELGRLQSATFQQSKRSEQVEKRSELINGLYADPNIAAYGCNYYIYATTDGFEGWGGQVFYTWKSSDLVSWSRSEQPFLTLNGTSGNVPWASGNAWAPTIIDKDGKYYFYFSGHNPTYDRKTIGVAVASSPEGPFTAQQTAMITNGEAVSTGQAIDPATFLDPNTGKYYLFWGNGSPLYAEFNDDMLSIKEDTIKPISGLTDFREGIFVNYRAPYYHLTYSIDDTGSENYRVGYATSESVDGPWTDRGLILQKDESQGILATGHSSILNVPGTDEWYIAYHRFNIPNGDGTHRETTIDRLTFGEDGLMQVVTPTVSGNQVMQKAAGCY